MATKLTASRASGRDVVALGDGASVAAGEAVDSNVTMLRLPVVGRVSLPPVDHLVWYGGVAVLTAVEMIEWPIALVLVVGRVLADNRTHRTVRAFGEALEKVD